MSDATLIKEVAAAIALTPEHGGRVETELAAWSADLSTNTWACEAGGLRLGGGSMPGWTTFDLRGHLLAARGQGRSVRHALVAAATNVCRDNLVDKRLQYTGLRKTVHAIDLALVRTNEVGVQVVDVKRPKTNREFIELRASSRQMWHAPRSAVTNVTAYASLHVQRADLRDHGSVVEVGSGVVSTVFRAGAGVLLVAPTPGTSDAETCAEVARALHYMRGAAPEGVSFEVRVARFRVV